VILYHIFNLDINPIYYNFRSQSESERVESLTTKIDEFLQDDNATPEQVKNIANECLQAEMTMDAAQIQALADQINEATGI
jgi:hypothetical protein